MFNAIKKILKPELPSIMAEVERELHEAEREFLHVMTKADYYIAMTECHASRVHRLREALKTQNVLAMPDMEEQFQEVKARVR